MIETKLGISVNMLGPSELNVLATDWYRKHFLGKNYLGATAAFTLIENVFTGIPIIISMVHETIFIF